MTMRGSDDGHRDLDWDGCWNVRDFGGLPLVGGGTTPAARVVRADSPDQLSAAGWNAVWGFGVRTVIDLRRVDECAAEVARPRGLDVHRVSWDDYPDQAWNERHALPGLPDSMRAFLRDYPVAVADTARILLGSSPGAVLVHCKSGRDRTGLFAIVLGALVGVDKQALYDEMAQRWLSVSMGHRYEPFRCLRMAEQHDQISPWPPHGSARLSVSAGQVSTLL